MKNKKAKILVVEDEALTAKGLKLLLEDSGYEVIAILSTGEEAVAQVQKTEPDLVLMDIMLEGKIDGIEASDKIRETNDIPIVYLSADSEKRTLERAKESHPFGYIIKPFNEHHLYNTIEMALYKHEVEKRLRREKEINGALAHLSQALLQSLSSEDISKQVLEQANLLTNSRFGFIGYIDPQSGHLIINAITKEIWQNYEAVSKKVVFKKFTGLWGWVLKNRQTLLCNEPDEDPRSTGTPEGHIPIINFIGVPAMVEDNLVGIVAVANKKENFEENDARIIERLAAVYALVLRQKQAESELNRYKEQLEQMVEARTLELGITNKKLRAEIEVRKKAEEKIRQQNKLLENILESLTHPFYVVNAVDYTIILANSAAKAQGIKEGERCFRVLHHRNIPCYNQPYPCPINLITKAKEPTAIEHIHVNQHKETRHVDIHGYPVFDKDGTVTHVIKYTIDISPRKWAEKELQESQARYKSLFQHSPVGIFKTTPEGQLLMANPAFIKMVGYSTFTELSRVNLGKNNFSLTLSYREFVKMMEKKGGIKGLEDRWRTKDGREIFIRQSIRVERDEDGDIISYEGTVEDITETKKAEEKAKLHEQQLLQADKMIALGTLVSGVAHEINNPTNFVMMNTPLLEELWQGILPILEKYYENNGDFTAAGFKYSEIKESVPGLFSGVLEGARRIKNIVKELKDFSRQETDEIKESVDINMVVKSAVTLTAPMIRKSTNHFTENYGQHIPTIPGKFQRLEQVMINLIQNSCHALPDKDKGLCITTNFEGETGKITIIIEDEGIGIESHNLKLITNPFFTTKRNSGGTGLGLSISSNIITSHNGTIDFESTPGKGTTVTVTLPVIAGENMI
jgi:PAS domain S-box-containing protein